MTTLKQIAKSMFAERFNGLGQLTEMEKESLIKLENLIWNQFKTELVKRTISERKQYKNMLKKQFKNMYKRRYP